MISVTLLAKNSEKYLFEVLSALTSFDEVLVADTGSSDRTKEIAHSFKNVRLIEIPFEGFGKTHNEASSRAKYDWILSIDSDEVMTESLLNEIQQLSLDPKKVYSIPRDNYYRGVWIKSCGWYPDRVLRLYNKNETHFSTALVHESIEMKGMQEVKLKSPLKHYPYSDVSDFLDKMQRYSSLFAKQYAGKRKSSHLKALLHGLAAFFKSYILKGGLFQGGLGFEISFYNGVTAFYKYLKLAYEA